ncbi:TonB-dependent receptor [Sphingomonas sp.]|jgi:outer membrane receptor protein involved in Fe transport|uniref:TonB-dependent receptor n=1 Tax=Sphingomonas sp. TaxID=28214 RepID=UPI002635DF5E|nr:TonB-dependent receptor [Sphingomonas sp.]MDF2605232.1 TonB-dependent receptor [Sphingomonas sp.]
MLRSTASILALAISTVSVSAAAQEAASASANPANDPAAPVPATSTADATRSPQADDGEIIVTAQKREQRLQDVPVVVSVLNQQQLENAGVRDVKDLQTITPGLNVTSSTSPAQTSIRIRGVGTVGDNPGLESSVGTIVDGVYRARSGVAFGDLGELERVEVLKGPQSTLFGKNMSAGVINVISASPSFNPSAEFVGSYGNYNAWTVSGAATGGLIGDTVAGRIFALKRERDGFWKVRTGAGPRTSTRADNENNWTVRAQLLIRPTDRVDIRLIGDWSERDEDCCVNAPSIPGPTAAFVDALAPDAGTLRNGKPFDRITYANRPTDFRIRDRGVSGQLDWELSDALSLTSITAYRYYKSNSGVDVDYSSADIWYRGSDGNSNQFKVFSQEARLAYNSERINSILGVFYADERLESRQNTFFGSDYERYFGLLLSGGTNPNAVSALTGIAPGSNFVPNTGQRDFHRHRASSFAIFTDNTFTIADGLDLTLGIRYTDEVKRTTSQYTNSSPANACAAALARRLPAAAITALCSPTSDVAFNDVTTEQRRPENRWAGSAKLQYRFSPTVMAYGSYANGFKSGGFNLDRARTAIGVINPDTSFATEKVESYEIGTKTSWLGQRLLANIAAFYQTYTDFQLNTYTGVSFVVTSIPKVTSKGVDLDLLFNTGIQGLTLNAGATYADTKFGDFPPPLPNLTRLSGNQLPYAAKWNVTAGFTSKQPMTSDLNFLSSASLKWTSSYNTGSNLDPLKVQQPFALLNARVGIEPTNEAWSLEVWAQNLTNSNYYQVIVDQPLQSGTYGAFIGQPRLYGVTGRVRF